MGLNEIHQSVRSTISIRCTIGSTTTHNIHKDDTRAQEGGTTIITYNQLANLQNLSGVEVTSICRWYWIKPKDRHKYVTQIICAYQPLKTGHVDVV